MTYDAVLNWMFNQLPVYQNQGKTAYKANLDNIQLLSDHLNNPHLNFKSIHVAGTNGKGSTSHMIASVLQESGYKVGLYTSPHLKDFRERIKINGTCISEDKVIEFITANKSFLEVNQLSFFEMTVGMAFKYFSDEQVDIAVIEVGLGGRLDATNIITPEVSVITNIGLDHVQFLGDSLVQIAAEKAGIIKTTVPVVVGQTQQETAAVFKKIASDFNAPIYFSDQEQYQDYTSDLKGSYQKHNIKTALKIFDLLQSKQWQLGSETIEKGLNNVIKNTGLMGRWQILSHAPFTVCDTAHNEEGLRYTLNQIQAINKADLHIVFGVVEDKDLSKIITLLPKNATYYLCAPSIKRAMAVDKLHVIFKQFGLHSKPYNSVQDAFNRAKLKATKNDAIYVGGSTFVVAEII